MIIKICSWCDGKFQADRSKRRFCSIVCCGKAMCRVNGFQPGHRGYVNATTFQKGQAAHNELPLGSVALRDDHGSVRAFVKTEHGWQLRARLVWEATYGPIPRGRVIHHRNRDPLDDRIENLACLTRNEHAKEHQDECKEAQWGMATRGAGRGRRARVSLHRLGGPAVHRTRE